MADTATQEFQYERCRFASCDNEQFLRLTRIAHNDDGADDDYERAASSFPFNLQYLRLVDPSGDSDTDSDLFHL